MVRDAHGHRRPEASGGSLAEESRLLQMIAEGGALNEVLRGLCDAIEQLVEGGVASILLVDMNSNRLRHAASPSLAPVYTHAIDAHLARPVSSTFGNAIHSGYGMLVSDIAQDACWSGCEEFIRTCHSPLSCLAFPIISSARQVLGSFLLYLPVVGQDPAGPRTILRSLHTSQASPWSESVLMTRCGKVRPFLQTDKE